MYYSIELKGNVELLNKSDYLKNKKIILKKCKNELRVR